MEKQLSQKSQTGLAGSFASFVKQNEVLFYSIIILLSLINLVLAGNFISKLTSSNLITESASASVLPILKIVQPAPYSEVSGNLSIVLSYQDNPEGFLSVIVLVDGIVENEMIVTGPEQLSFTLDTTKFSNGSHKITLKATDTQERTQTLQMDLNFQNKTSKKKI